MGDAVGKRADFVVWDIERPADLCYWIGGSLARRVIAGGEPRTG
jgi:imidazolonepropionase